MTIAILFGVAVIFSGLYFLYKEMTKPCVWCDRKDKHFHQDFS